MGPLPLSVPSHYRYIVAFAEAGPIGHVTIQCLAQINEQHLAKAVHDYILRHPEVKEILYDKAFDVDRVTAVLDKYKVDGRKVSAGSHHRIVHVERFFRTLQTQMIVLVTDAQCPQGYWPLAASHVTYLFNTLPRQRHQWKSNIEMAGFKRPHLGPMKQFGREAYAVNHLKDQRLNGTIGSSSVTLLNTPKVVRSTIATP